jgi:adenosine deaminase
MQIIQCTRARVMPILALLAATIFFHPGTAVALQGNTRADFSSWFEQFKQDASDEDLYRFLYAMPKGGDLHNHSSGSIRSEWLYELATAQESRGYVYYTRVRINNCRPYGENRFAEAPYLMMFVNIQHSSWAQLGECERGEYSRLQDLDAEQRDAWMNSLRLDKSYEGRNEFFETHWQRMNHLFSNPYLIADALVRNMQAFAAEGMIYLEAQMDVRGYLRHDGSPYSADEVAAILRQRLVQKDAVTTGVEVRLQLSLLRFLPDAEQHLEWLYEFVADNNDLWVAVNMVGREDNDKGHPLRFLDTLRKLRQTNHGVRLSIHAGEVDEPNHHVRDTLLLGADRIGHGMNLISDPDTLRLMRHGPYLVEINLISNLLLEYVSDYSQHPFPEYLRTGIPVALSTDDRGMWDSNLTDEFFVAVKEFNLSWAELVMLSRNSLSYSFAPDAVKTALLQQLDENLDDFTGQLKRKPAALLSADAVTYGFSCRYYQLCSVR